MPKPLDVTTQRFTIAIFLSLVLLTFATCASSKAQQPASSPLEERERGIQLYKQGDTKGAIDALHAAVKNQKEDGDAWFYLGLAMNRDGDVKGARKAFEMTVRFRPTYAAAHAALAYTLLVANKMSEAEHEAKRALLIDAQNGDAHYVIGVVRLRNSAPGKALEEADAALKTNADFAPALLLKSQALINIYLQESFAASESVTGPQPPTAPALEKVEKEQKAIATRNRARFNEAIESLEKYLKLAPNNAEADTWREQLESLRVYAKVADESKSQRSVFLPSEVTTKARILSKPEPQYTESARQAGVVGIVILRAILASDGTVQSIFVFRSLSHGLTEKAVKVARQIKFIPATKDGRTVSEIVMLEYYFNLY